MHADSLVIGIGKHPGRQKLRHPRSVTASGEIRPVPQQSQEVVPVDITDQVLPAEPKRNASNNGNKQSLYAEEQQRMIRKLAD